MEKEITNATETLGPLKGLWGYIGVYMLQRKNGEADREEHGT